MRCAKFKDFARLLMRLAQIGVVIAQSKIVESRRPIGYQRHEEEHRGEQPGAQARSAASFNRNADVPHGDGD